MKKIGILNIISFLMVIVLLFNNAVITSYGFNNEFSENVEASLATEELSEEIIGEDVTKREEYTKHFYTSNNTFVAANYKNPVHYFQDGQYKDINNTLIDSTTEEDVVVNKSNDFKIKFHKNPNNVIGEIRLKDSYIQWKILNSNDCHGAIENTEKEQTDEYELSALYSNIIYKNIFDNIDLRYDLISKTAKENFIIKQKTNISSIKFLYRTNLSPILENNQVKFVAGDKTKFILDAPYAFDNNKNYNKNITLSIDPTDEGYIISYNLDKNWLNNNSRSYPITIDPGIYIPGQYALEDAYVFSGYPKGCFLNEEELSIGVDQNGIYRTYITFNNLPEIPNTSKLLSAKVTMFCVDSAYNLSSQYQPNSIEVYKVNGNINYANLTWSSQPVFSEYPIDLLIKDRVETNTEFDITSIYQNAVENSENISIMLKTADEDNLLSTTGYRSRFMSLQNTSPMASSARPSLLVSYTDNSGMEDIWSGTISSNKRTGAGIVKHNNGKLYFTLGILSSSAARMPVSFCLIYNQERVKTLEDGLLCGRGWTTNFHETLKLYPDNASYKAIYTDSDGTKHYFATLNARDRSGLGLTLTNINGKMVLIDRAGNKKTFRSDGKLEEIQDMNGDVMTLSYVDKTSFSNQTISVLSKITDGAGREYIIDSTAQGYLLSITDPAGKVTSFRYNGIALNKITYYDGKMTFYEYDSNYNLTNAKNFDGTNLEYVYSDSKVIETNLYHNLELKNKTTYSYEDGITYITDVTDNNKTSKVLYNNEGKTYCYIDSNGGVSAKYYGEESEGYAMYNKVTSSSSVFMMPNNLLKNGNLEANGGSTYGFKVNTQNFNGDCRGRLVGRNDSYGENIFGNTASGTLNFEQTINLDAGSYVFSGYVKQNKTKYNKDAKMLRVFYTDDNGDSVMLESEPVDDGGDVWSKHTIKFDLPSVQNVKVQFGIYECICNAYFDDFTLEKKDEQSNKINMINNSGFETGLEMWNVADNSVDICTTEYNNGAQSLKITGDPLKSKFAQQTFKRSGKEGDSFTAKASAKILYATSINTLNDVNKNTLSLDVIFKNTDGTYTTKSKTFDKYNKNWQSVLVDAQAEKDYSEVTLRLNYNYNINSVLFDDIGMYCTGLFENYLYDEEGVPVTVEDSFGNQNVVQHDEKDNITGITSDGYSKSYNYNDKNNLVSASDNTTSLELEYGTGNNQSNVTHQKKIAEDGTYLEVTSEYSASGNYKTKNVNANGIYTEYNYDTAKEILLSIKAGRNGSVLNYGYDEYDRKTSNKIINNGKDITSLFHYYDDKDELKDIVSSNGGVYTFDYDFMGNITQANILGVTSEYEYDNNGYLKNTIRRTNSNIEKKESFLYNDLNLLRTYSQYIKNGNLRKDYGLYRYTYDIDNRIIEKKDDLKHITESYDYNELGFIEKITNSRGLNTKIKYDGTKANFIDCSLKIDNGVLSNFNTYKQTDGKLTEVIKSNMNTVFQYDKLKRITSYTYKDEINGSDKYKIKYNYVKNNNKTSNMISSVDLYIGNNKVNEYIYTYDETGRIKTEKELSFTNNVSTVQKFYEYEYDALSQLVSTTDKLNNNKTVYSYDNNGNILSKDIIKTTNQQIINSYSWEYDSENKDILKKYMGKNVVYDKDLNPTSWNGWNMEFHIGRNLTKMFKQGGDIIEYKYDDKGNRIEKIVNGESTKYHMYGSTVIFEETPLYILSYTYNNSLPEGMEIYKKSSGELLKKYVYKLNLKGDIVGLIDFYTGQTEVEYTYDDWGELIDLTDISQINAGTLNPYRYRGYRYDEETGLYYLQSRYYDPEAGRFINGDGALSNNSVLQNLFMYCNNNPINYKDINGYFPTELFNWITDIGGYDFDNGVFYWDYNAPQQYAGFCDEYDEYLSPIIFNLSALTMYFSAEIQGKHYRVELWKGQYGELFKVGISTGCEVGVYYQTYDDDHPIYKTNEFWKVDRVGHLFEISLKLYYNDGGHAGKHIFSRGAQLTWWLNGFKPFLSVLPTDLYMEAIIDFNNPVVGDIFYNNHMIIGNNYKIYPVDMIPYNDRYLIQWWG